MFTSYTSTIADVMSRELNRVLPLLLDEDNEDALFGPCVVYLSQFPPEVALVTARQVELKLAEKYYKDQWDWIYQGNIHHHQAISPNDLRRLFEQLSDLRYEKRDEAAEQRLLEIFGDNDSRYAWYHARRLGDLMEKVAGIASSSSMQQTSDVELVS
jgi:hypothetical protein